MLMKLHLIESVPDHRLLVVDQPQSGDVHVVVTEVFQVQSLQVLRQTTALLQLLNINAPTTIDASILQSLCEF